MNIVSNVNIVKEEIYNLKDEEYIKTSRIFHKTSEGSYAEHDEFLGIKVPEIKKIAKKRYDMLILQDIMFFLDSNVNEYRMFAVFVLVFKYEKGDINTKKEVFSFYIKNASKIKGWGVVDSSAPNIVGDFVLKNKDYDILYDFAASDDLWKKRISVVANYRLIKNNNFEHILEISKILINDCEDLIRKAIRLDVKRSW